ncbi:hypothetical protein M0811_10472 [Anaeramoeba ignava]|uniref:Uncharacterized protein n=1 Tax=Anaeramoeba ignava TaxID=1746090 RepID=A0A9Q0LEY4_ANAIG|nr:hypothetical protein M0811_10472 [Anaeramoeba ignava]
MILKDFPEILILTTKKTNLFNKNKENINGKDDLFVPRDEKEEICQKYELIAIFHQNLFGRQNLSLLCGNQIKKSTVEINNFREIGISQEHFSDFFRNKRYWVFEINSQDNTNIGYRKENDE